MNGGELRISTGVLVDAVDALSSSIAVVVLFTFSRYISMHHLGLSFSNREGTYVECPLHGRNLFRHQDDIEGIHLRLREADVHIPWNPASMYMPFGSSGRRCFDA